MKRFSRLRKPHLYRQNVFSFVARSQRRRRWFKSAILLVFAATIAIIVAGLPKGRYVVASFASEARKAARYSIGLPTPRTEIDDDWKRFRLEGIADSKRALRNWFKGIEPPNRRFMTYAGLDPEHGIVRWGNFNRTMVLASTVFEADDTGRSYRLLPGVRSVWVRNISLGKDVIMFFLVPDRPGLREAIDGTTGIIVEGSRQTTNSWGLRGPEPISQAPLRGIVLGDSFMQALFIGDDETPAERLRHYLEHHLGTTVSILNTGHLGYSPEQYYHTLMAYAERFRPHFVVVSVFANDFGDLFEAVQGKVDWEESNYWLNKIADFCRSRQLTPLFVIVPLLSQMLGKRNSGFYPGMVSNLLETSGSRYLNPIEAFVNTHLRLINDATLKGNRPANCPLFNGRISDGHFSALGADLWAQRVGERLALLLCANGVIRQPPSHEIGNVDGDD
jgi:hypothetical protein